MRPAPLDQRVGSQSQNQCHQRPMGLPSWGGAPRTSLSAREHHTGAGPCAAWVPVPWPAALGFLPVEVRWESLPQPLSYDVWLMTPG